MSLREGVTKSVNPFFAALNVKLGACSVRDTMVKMGLHRADGKLRQWHLDVTGREWTPVDCCRPGEPRGSRRAVS